MDENLGQNALCQAQAEPRSSGCGECAKSCPMQNIKIAHGKARFGERCTLCYRCVHKCRQKAITILGKAANLEKSVAAKFKDI